MAGTAERQALKKAAMLALDQSRTALGGELLRLRTEWSPRELVRHSFQKHRVAIVAGALLAGLVVTRFIMTPGRVRNVGATLRGRVMGLATAALWSALRKPLMDFAKSYFPAYFHHSNPSPADEPS